MGACFLDLIPDVDEIFQQVSNILKEYFCDTEITLFLVLLNSQVLEDVKTEYGITIDLPLVPFIVVVGFMLILIIEQTVLHFQVGTIYS